MELEDLNETIKAANRAATDQNTQVYEMLMDLMSRMKPPDNGEHPGRSDDTTELDAAFVKAQGEIHSASKDSTNPFHDSKYADLASCWGACREVLSKHDLGVRQFTIPHPQRYHINIVTKLVHKSGQWESGLWPQRCQDRKRGGGWFDSDDPQTQGTAFTYGRRYALCGMLGIAPADSDAEPEGYNNQHKPKHDSCEPRQGDTKTDIKTAQSSKPAAKQEEKTPPAKKTDAGAISQSNVKKLETAMEKGGLDSVRKRELLDTFEVGSLAELPHAEFINFMQCIAKAAKILKEGN